MNVAELRKVLDKYPDDMECVVDQYSDYAPLNESGCGVVKGVPHHDWIMISHPTMSDNNKEREIEYLCLRCT